jgi:hypothetical protein
MAVFIDVGGRELGAPGGENLRAGFWGSRQCGVSSRAFEGCGRAGFVSFISTAWGGVRPGYESGSDASVGFVPSFFEVERAGDPVWIVDGWVGEAMFLITRGGYQVLWEFDGNRKLK